MNCVIKIYYKILERNKLFDTNKLKFKGFGSGFISKSVLDNQSIFIPEFVIGTEDPLVVGHTLEEAYEFIDNELKRIIYKNMLILKNNKEYLRAYKLYEIFIYDMNYATKNKSFVNFDFLEECNDYEGLILTR